MKLGIVKPTKIGQPRNEAPLCESSGVCSTARVRTRKVTKDSA
jgi:hypothetical protein